MIEFLKVNKTKLLLNILYLTQIKKLHRKLMYVVNIAKIFRKNEIIFSREMQYYFFKNWSKLDHIKKNDL